MGNNNSLTRAEVFPFTLFIALTIFSCVQGCSNTSWYKTDSYHSMYFCLSKVFISIVSMLFKIHIFEDFPCLSGPSILWNYNNAFCQTKKTLLFSFLLGYNCDNNNHNVILYIIIPLNRDGYLTRKISYHCNPTCVTPKLSKQR